MDHGASLSDIGLNNGPKLKTHRIAGVCSLHIRRLRLLECCAYPGDLTGGGAAGRRRARPCFIKFRRGACHHRPHARS